ncbi:hypothetical protein KO465_10530 [Candidatus Micrarchaeota archaeon]|nr:hypothetical protein [Candidatus Micrarchaeota archaeon]
MVSRKELLIFIISSSLIFSSFSINHSGTIELTNKTGYIKINITPEISTFEEIREEYIEQTPELSFALITDNTYPSNTKNTHIKQYKNELIDCGVNFLYEYNLTNQNYQYAFDQSYAALESEKGPKNIIFISDFLYSESIDLDNTTYDSYLCYQKRSEF